MRIGAIGGPAIGPATRRASIERPEPETETRALIAVEAPAPTERSLVMTRHPAAPFLAHLIATQMQAPQTRARRRAEPDEAIASYGVTAAPGPVQSRRPFRKSA